MGAYTEDDVRMKLQSYLGKVQQGQPANLTGIVSQSEAAYRKKHGREMSIASKAVLAKSMNEMVNRLLASGRSLQEINSAAENIADVNNPISMLFNLMSILIPNFTYAEVCGIQPLPTATSPIFYPAIYAKDSRNNVTAGDTLLGANGWEQTSTYTSNKVTRTFALAASTSQSLTMNYPEASGNAIYPNSVSLKITISGVSFYVCDDGEGALPAITAAGFAGGTVTYSTGVVAFTLASAASITDSAEVTYRYQVSASRAPAQAVLEWITRRVDAQPYSIRSTYKIDNMLAAKQVLAGYDIDEVLSSGLAGYINKEISAGTFDDIRARSDSTYGWSKTVPTAVPWSQHRFGVLQTIIEQSNYIRGKVNRSAGNILIMDNELANIIETFGSDVFAAKKYDSEPIGPYVEGVILDRITVVKNQDFGTEGSAMVYKTSDTDASFLGGSFISLYSTPPVSLDTLNTIQGFGTQVGFVKSFTGSISKLKITT